jgi:hypothetical protein
MENKVFSPSINIERDFNRDIDYITTPNAEKVFNNIINNYKKGFSSFNIVGAYGTGKSSFLISFEKTINNKELYFDYEPSSFIDVQGFDFLNFVGEYNSLIEVFAQKFNLSAEENISNRKILDELDDYYSSIKKINKGLVIVIDEFGKFLEYAAKNNPEEELYFIQNLAEYANDAEKNIIFITTLHQNFHAYSLGLSRAQKQEWDKVQGRLKEITFNEPVEQLLLLASKRLKNFHSDQKEKKFDELFKAIEKSGAFPLTDYFTENIARSLLPFDILAASILTLSLQEYGQNQRSLFSFIESEDHLSLSKFNLEINPYYNLSCVYDYLIYNFYSLLSTKYNPHYTQWTAIKNAIERAEGVLDQNIGDAIKLIKTIGLIDIFASKGANIDRDFLDSYGQFSLGIKEPNQVIKTLEKHKIVIFSRHNNKYKLFEGTDLDIELAIDQAGNLVERVSNVVSYLNEYFDFPIYQAKYISLEKGTPRFFSFKLSEEPINETPQNEIDGYINLIFNENFNQADIADFSYKTEEAILYGFFDNVSDIKNTIYEIEKVIKVKKDNPEDKVALKELDSIIDHYRKLLNHQIIGSLYNENSTLHWYFKGEKIEITSFKGLNRALSNICDSVYPSTPTYQSELINRTKLSGAISNSRKLLIDKLIENSDKKDLGFEEGKYPPEKTIYLSLLKQTGIHKKKNNKYILQAPEDKSFQDLWEFGVRLLDESKQYKKKVSEFFELLKEKPFKLKDGFIDFWVPIFLYINRNSFALYNESGYVPMINKETLWLLTKNPKEFTVKAFDFSEGKLELFNKYRELLNQVEEDQPTNQSFIELIKPFFSFYKGLTDYSKNTQKLSKNAIRFRESLKNAEEPEALFFEEIPRALGYNIEKLYNDEKLVKDFIIDVKNHIAEINSSYDNLINRIESFIVKDIFGKDINFPDYKTKLQERYKNLNPDHLQPKQKVFYQRIQSPLDDRKSWLNSLVQAVINKSAEKISDKDEEQFYHNLRNLIYELDNLTEISQDEVDETSEDFLKVEVTSLIKGVQKNLIRLPKSKSKEAQALEKKIKSNLTDDKNLNIKLLVKLLQEQIDYDKES